MITNGVQRWRDRRDSYRPAGETIATSEFDIAPISRAVSRTFVSTHHYAGTYPAARYDYGLYRAGELAGVAVFSHPTNDRVLSMFPGAAVESIELGRFVLLDSVPANGETWFLARCFEALRREGLIGVVSFSDPTARSSADGRTVFAGHIGTIYQAHNATYMGRGTARTLRLLPDGRVFSDRAYSKLRAQDKGWKYAMEQLIAAGAVAWDAREPVVDWARREVARITRPLTHPGNHRYAWSLQRTRRAILPPSQPYPKIALRLFA